jgi:two-component system, NarL family, nitrate/nitrite response regulator NarL
MKRIRLVLVDDHPIVLDGLEQLFHMEPDLEVVGRATTAEAAVSTLAAFRPDIVVLDLAMPNHDGLWVVEQLSKLGLPTRVVLLTAHLDESRLVEAVRLGVAGIVLKEMAPRLLVECVRKVHAGEKWLERQSVARAMDRVLRRESDLQQISRILTPREIEIVRLVTEGLRNREIAERLTITEGTVKIHLHNIYEKLGVSGRPQLILFATRQGITPDLG